MKPFVPVILMLVATPALAMRTPAPEVPPLEHNGVRYIAPNRNGRKPTLRSWDIRTGTKLWEVVVYRNRIDPSLEEDVQWVFIETLEVIEGKLAVTNERGKTYLVDLKTGQVQRARWPHIVVVLVIAALIGLVLMWRIRKTKCRQMDKPA